MKLALVSDIHGNLEALTAVLQDIEQQDVDRIHCLGDVVGYGSDPKACLELVAEHCDLKLMGNHEYVVLGLESDASYTHVARVAAEWTRQQLSSAEFDLMSSFAMQHHIDEMDFVHASPYEPDQWHYVLSPEDAGVAFEHLRGRLCFHGHTHIPMVFTDRPESLPRRRAGHSFVPDEEARYLINIGSVGQPRDNDPRSCYVVYDTVEGEATYRRVEYDIKTTQSKMAQADLPELLIDRLSVGR